MEYGPAVSEARQSEVSSPQETAQKEERDGSSAERSGSSGIIFSDDHDMVLTNLVMVPEPSSAVLIGTVGLIAIFRRKRRPIRW